MIKIKKSKNRQWFFTIVSKHNGKVLATSETYTRRNNCVGGVNAIVKQMKTKPVIVDETR